MKLHNTLYLKIANAINEAIKAGFDGTDLSVEEIYQGISPAPNTKMGHFAFACFSLAKLLKSNPAQIGKTLGENLNADLFENIQIAGPYINFKIKNSDFYSEVIRPINSGEYFKRDFLSENPKTMIEYSQPNTHKVLHVGHMRNLCLGNAIIRMNRAIGRDILAVTYPGDVGTHVAKCLWYMKHHNQEQVPSEHKGAWLGELYTKANNKLEDEKGTDKEDQNRAELTEILKQLHGESGEYYDLWKETKEWSFNLMKEAYDWADVKFDRWFTESEMDAPSVAYAKELYEKGILVEDDGAIGMNLEDDKLGFCLLIKSDGTGLYATKDVLLAKKKFEEFKIKKNIYVVDNRQAFHFQQVFKVLERLGFEDAKDCFHLQYDVVELPDGAMSSRKGNIVPLMDLISQMEDKIKSDYLEKYRGEWTDQEIDETARIVAGGAIKYGMIKVDNNRKIVFDMNEWLKLDGDTGPYLQYVHARINSICEKLGFEQSQNANLNSLQKPQEIDLLIKLSVFNSVLVKSALDLKTVSLCSYLFELGKLFNSFYAECSINNAESEELKIARLHLARATGEVMRVGLNALGITAPKKM